MTIEEAKEKIIKSMKCHDRKVCGLAETCEECPLYVDKDTEYEAHKVLISALEQKPCEDAVSRQVVLDLVVANHTELNGLNVVMYSPFYKDITQLPPVTVRQSECLKTQAMPMSCNDCCYEPNSPFCEMYRKDICEKKEERQTGKWISVSERLPEGLLVKVLVSCEDSLGLPIVPKVVIYDGYEHSWECNEKVIAWMPLPKPYEPQESEDKK